MRTIWKGTISFGLVMIGIKLSAATEERDVKFHQVHAADGGRIKYRRYCSDCEREVPFESIAKGHEVGEEGKQVILTEADFAGLPLATSKVIDVLEFVPAEQIDPILYGKAYFLAPSEMATVKPYALFRDALAESGRVAVVKVALRQREHLAMVRVHEGALLLNTMFWPDEVRAPAFPLLKEGVDVRPRELAMAGSLIEAMTGTFNPAAHTDGYRTALQEVIAAKAEGREVAQPAAIEMAPVEDLTAALEASLRRERVIPIHSKRPAGKPAQPTRARRARVKVAA